MRAQNSPSLEIDLCGTTVVMVDQIVLHHTLVGTGMRRLIRGKVSSTVQGGEPLPWTSAVRAFIILTVQVALRKYTTSESEIDPFSFGLWGNKGSLCRSLDYAIAKRPGWIMDLFGSNADGEPLVGRFFWRKNPEGKRPGPTAVTLNTKMLAPATISLRLNGRPLSKTEELQHILDSLEAQNKQPSTSCLSSRTLSSVEHAVEPMRQKENALQATLGSIIKRELRRALSSTRIFSLQDLTGSLKHIQSSVLFQTTARQHTKALESILECTSHGVRTGISPSSEALLRVYSSEKPLRVSVSVVTVGTIVLFQYLKMLKGFPIEINYRFATGIEVARAVQGASIEPDVCVGAAPSASMLMASKSSPTYQPVMLMPKHSHRLLTSRNGANSVAHGDYRLLTDEPSGALSYFQELVRHGVLDKDKVALNHCDPDEALHLLAQGAPDMHSILWFPAYDFAQIYCGAKLLDTSRNDLGDSWILLLAHDRLRSNKQALSILVTELHGAWLDLQENERLLDKILATMLSDPEYLKVLTRSHGFHKLQPVRHAGVTLLG